MTVDVQRVSMFFGKNLIYKSHIKENESNELITQMSFFESNKCILFQNINGVLELSKFGMKENVKIISFHLSRKGRSATHNVKLDQISYSSSKDQQYFWKKCLPITNFKLYQENIKNQN